MKLSNFKSKMIAKAQKSGIVENFGQSELRKLQDKYGYNPYGTTKEREICAKIDALDNWCMNYDGK